MTDYGFLSPAEQAIARRMGVRAQVKAKPTPPPREVVFFPVPVPAPAPALKAKPSTDRAAFNAVQFHTDLMNAARQLGVTKRAAVAKDAGVRDQAIQCMKRGIAPDLATCLLLCDWAGLDPLRYLIHIAPPAANDTTGRAAA